MNAYKVLDPEQGGWRVVEAESFARAVEIWQAHIVAELKRTGDYEAGDEDTLGEPASVELISDEPVLR